MPSTNPLDRFTSAIAERTSLIDPSHRAAFRAFNGHLEGDPRYVVDVYATTAVIAHRPSTPEGEAYRSAPGAAPGLAPSLDDLIATLRVAFPWLTAVVVKERDGTTDEERRGRVVYEAPGGPGVATEVLEHGVRYALEPCMNQDASLYLDTRNLRRWLIDHADGADVLNTFAYTGSLGVAALAGGAASVLHTDLSRRFLSVAKRSHALNGFEIERKGFQARDFFSFVRGQKLQGARHDLAILDPPFFSSTAGGTVDLSRNLTRLVNKLRPLIRSDGRLIVVNNSLFVTGATFLQELEALCTGGWMSIERTIDVPDDVAGYPSTRRNDPVADPAPFNHSTKIVILTVRHKA